MRNFVFVDDEYALEEEIKSWAWAQSFDDYCGCCETFCSKRKDVFSRPRFIARHVVTALIAAAVAAGIILLLHISSLLGALLTVAVAEVAGFMILAGFFQHVDKQLDACKMHMRIHESRWPAIYELARECNFDASVVPPEPESALDVSRRTRSGWRRLDEDDIKDDGNNSVSVDGLFDDIAADMDAIRARDLELIEVEATDAETDDTSEAEPEPEEEEADEPAEVDASTVVADDGAETFNPPEEPEYFDGVADELSEEAPVEPEGSEPVAPRSTEDLLEEIRRMLD